MKAGVLGAVFVATVGVSALAYNIQVVSVSNFRSSFRRLAILPPVGPLSVDLEYLERVAIAKMSARSVNLYRTGSVRQIAFDRGIREYTPDVLRDLSQLLDVDAFMAIEVLEAESRSTGGAVGLFFQSGLFAAASGERHTGSMRIAIVSAETGRTLLQASAGGETEWRTKQGLLNKMCEEILDKAFPAPVSQSKK